MLIFALNFLLVGFSSFFFSAIFEQKSSLSDFILRFFTFFLAQIILLEICLGIPGLLFTQNIILGEASLFLLSLSLYSLKKDRFKLSPPDLKFIFDNKILLFSIAVFIAFFGSKLLYNLVNPPICPDSLQYHLSFPAAWIQNGNLNNPIVIMGSQPTSAELTALSYYPMNAELFFFWLMFPLKNAFLADIGEAPFYFMGILAVYSILRKFNLKKDTALLAGMIWVLIPNLLKQMRFGSQVDVICAVLFLLALNGLLIWGRAFNFKNACFFGIVLGLLIGTKILNIYWIIALLPLCGYVLIANTPGRWKHSVFFLFSILFLVFIFGGFTYLRTFLLTGNPLYPVQVTLFGKALFPGFIDKETFSRIFVNWNEFKLYDLFFSEGLGAQFIFFVTFGTFVPIIAMLVTGKKFNFSREFIFLSFAPVIMFFLFIFVIKAYWVRYLFPFLAIGIIAAFIFLDKFKWGRKYITILGLICIFSSAAELAHRKELVISLTLSFLLFIFFVFYGRKIKSFMGYLMNGKAVILLFIALLLPLYFLNERYNREEFSRIPGVFTGREGWQKDLGYGWLWLNEHTGSGKRLAYTGRNEFYLLFGEKLKNRVLYISTNDKPALAHYYRDGLYRKDKVFDAWLKNLKENKIDYLFVALPQKCSNESSNKDEFPVEDQWALSHAELFKPVFSNSQVHIYSVKYSK